MTYGLEIRCSIQLSYGRKPLLSNSLYHKNRPCKMQNYSDRHGQCPLAGRWRIGCSSEHIKVTC